MTPQNTQTPVAVFTSIHANPADMKMVERALNDYAALEAENAALRKALEPFANYVFGPQYIGHSSGTPDHIVLCGYDGEGNTTGVNVLMSDFNAAKSALTRRA